MNARAPLLLLTLALLGCPANGSDAPQAATQVEAIAVEVDAVQRRDLASLYSTSATLRAERDATVIARTRGVVEELLVEEGDVVQAGQALAVLEDDEQKIEQARTAAVAAARLRDLERTRELHTKGALPDNALNDAETAWDEAQHLAELAALRLERTRITAPYAGRVLTRHVDVGETVADGTPILDMADVDPLMADVSVPERHVAPLNRGQTVRLVADATGEQVAARIVRVAPRVDATTGTVKVTLAVDGETTLRPGTFVRVDVVVETRPQALVVPRPALVAVGQRWFLYRVAGARAELIEVEPGFEEGEWVEVRTATPALAPGERVVVGGAAALSDGSALEVLVDRAPARQVTPEALPPAPGGLPAVPRESPPAPEESLPAAEELPPAPEESPPAQAEDGQPDAD